MSAASGGLVAGLLVLAASGSARSAWRRLTAPSLDPHPGRRARRGVAWRRRPSPLRRRRPVADLGTFVEAAAGAAAGGVALLPALAVGAEVAGPPFVDAVARLLRRVEAGLPLDAALASWAAEVPGPESALVAATCRLGARLGRGTAVALEGLAASLGRQRQQRDELAVATSSALASTVLLCCLPLAVVALLGVADPPTVRWLLATPPGWVCLSSAAVLDLVGAAWMRRLVRGAA